jgi:pimeloyl-ACP methyl ester carboxylesterase
LAAIVLIGGGCADGEETGAETTATAVTVPDPIAPDSISFDDLEPCEDRRLPSELRCGTIDLPYERSDRSLGEIAIAFAVRPRDDRKSPSRGAVIAIEGGPGYGSIGSAKGYIHTFGDQLRHRDLVLVDARGTGSSEPIDCPDMQSGRATDDVGMAACADLLGPRFDSYRSAAVADDINDVRAALGYDEVQVYGDSYGTYLAQSYAFRHGDTLEALVLDSAYPVRGESAWYPSIWRTGIRGLEIACERSPDCAGDAGERLDRFVAELRERRLDVGPLLDAISEAGFSPPESYLTIDRAISEYLAGDEQRYEELTKEGHVGFGKPSGYSVGQELTISCNDYPMNWDKEASWEQRREQLSAAIEEYPKDAFEPFTPAEVALTPGYPYRECLGAPKPGELYEPAAAESAPAPDVPVLVISGELDDVTSPAEGRAAARLFPNAEFFLWRNAGHVQSLYDPDSQGAVRIRRFLSRNG